MSKKILIWDTCISNMLQGKMFGGVAVQLYFWSQIFSEKGWYIYSLTNDIEEYKQENIHFKVVAKLKHWSLISDFVMAYKYIRSIKPDLILMRGASNRLFMMSVLTRMNKIKLVYMGASDVNFEPGKEQINNEFNRKLFQNGLKHVNYIITQNEFQTNKVIDNYGKTPLQLNNIWGEFKLKGLNSVNCKKYDVVWIANIRKLKRIEWMLVAAKALPQYSFAIAGKFAESKEYEEKVLGEASRIKNLDYIGYLEITESNQLVTNSRLLACTSEFEGFPNTFLQAWSRNIPVISTVNPNSVIETHKLGMVVNTTSEFIDAIRYLLKDNLFYKKCQENINTYFKTTHDAISAYEKMMQYIEFDKV